MEIKNSLYLIILLLLNYSCCSYGFPEELFKYNKNSLFKRDNLNTSNNKKINYNFYCLKDYNNICEQTKSEIDYIVSVVSSLDIPLLNVDIIVDDFTKFKFKNDFNTTVIALNSNYEPLDKVIKERFDIYPNSKSIEKKIYKKQKKEKNDFIIIFNNLKNMDTNFMMSPYEYKILKEFSQCLNVKIDMTNDIEILNMYIESFMQKLEFDESEYHRNNTLICKGDKTMKKLSKKDYKRIIAVGDIHGDYQKLVDILYHAKLINKNKDWIGKDSILVQIGDLVDRGRDSKNILDLMIKLKNQAKIKGGVVNIILGNHELRNIQGFLDYTTISDIMEYGNIENRKKKFALNHKFGNLIRKEMDTIKIIDNIIFVHAGLTKEFAALGIENINNKIREVLIDAPYKFEVNNRTHEIFVNPLFLENGPLYTRYLTHNENEEEVCKELSEVFKLTNATKMVVGHTVQLDGKIQTLCNNQLINIDIGLTELFGSHFGYLEIKRDKNEFWAIYN